MGIFKTKKDRRADQGKKERERTIRQSGVEKSEDEYDEYGGLDPLIIQNIEYAKKHLHLSEPIGYDEDDGYVPEGCRACGGDYPLCKRGCPLFDED